MGVVVARARRRAAPAAGSMSTRMSGPSVLRPGRAPTSFDGDDLHHGRVETHRGAVARFEHKAHAAAGFSPPLASCVDVPRAGHAHVRMDDAIVHRDQEVLGPCFDAIHGAAYELLSATLESDVTGVNARDGASDQPLRERVGGAGEGVALRHGRLATVD